MTISRENQLRLDSYRRRLDLYYETEEKILQFQESRIGSRTYRRADLPEVQTAITELEGKISSLERNGSLKRKTARFIPRDI